MDAAQSNLQSGTDDKTVWLAIYDLSDQNWWTAHLGVGIFHSGVEVYGVEWAYGEPGQYLELTKQCHVVRPRVGAPTLDLTQQPPGC